MKIRSLVLATLLSAVTVCGPVSASSNKSNNDVPPERPAVVIRDASEITKVAFKNPPKHEKYCWHSSIGSKHKSELRCAFDSTIREINKSILKEARQAGFILFVADFVIQEMKVDLTANQLNQIMNCATGYDDKSMTEFLDYLDLMKYVYGYYQRFPAQGKVNISDIMFMNYAQLNSLKKLCRVKFESDFLATWIKKAIAVREEWRLSQNAASVGDARIPVSDSKISLEPLKTDASREDYKANVEERRAFLAGVVNQTGFAAFASTFAEVTGAEYKRPLSAEEVIVAKNTFSGFSVRRQKEIIDNLAKIYRTFGYLSKYNPDAGISILEICFLEAKSVGELNRICQAEFTMNGTIQRLERAKLLVKEIQAKRVAEHVAAHTNAPVVKEAPNVSTSTAPKDDVHPTIVEMDEPKE